MVKRTVFLMDIYDKFKQANITDAELIMLVNLLQENK
jgi:hypothetical protein